MDVQPVKNHDADLNLTPVQREAVEHGTGPLLIVAGAGTGKTLVITRRIAHLIRSKMARPEEILALTFTEKAAAEMAERVDVLLPYGYANIAISTFHAFGDRILREYGLELGLNPDFQVLPQAEQAIFFRERLFSLPLDLYRPLGDPTKFIQALLSVFSRCKDEDISSMEYLSFAAALAAECPGEQDPEKREHAQRQNEIAAAYAAYQETMAKEGKLDFGDQVFLVLRLFRERPTVLKRVQERYRFILVDEFQDTNYAQFQMVRLLGGQTANITVVGDDDQSIYKFRGAAISNILGFMNHYPKARQVVLTDNYRSTQIILDTAYRLILNNNPERLEVRNQIDKRLKAVREGSHPVEQMHCDTVTTESDRVASLILDLVKNKTTGFGDIAILVRTNNSADPFLKAMNLKEIPWRFTGNRGLYSQPEVRLLISFLRVLADPEDSVNLYNLASSEIYELPMEDLQYCANLAHKQNASLFEIFKKAAEIESGIGAEGKITIGKLVEDIRHYLNLSRDSVTGVVLYQFLDRSGYLRRLTSRASMRDSARMQNIARFFDTIWSFSQTAVEDRVLHFVRHLNLLIEAGDDPSAAEADPDADAVHVLTVHKAKGLEWPVVFLVGLVQNRFPHSRRKEEIELPADLIKERLPEGDFHLQEERRLFYVGMTRARDRLYLTSAADYGGVRRRKVSQFVAEALDRPHCDAVGFKAGAEERIRRFAPLPDEFSDGGAPIPEGTILTLSPYQIDDYLTCPLKYKYVHILRVPILEHHSVMYGKALHAAVEMYNRQRVNGIAVQYEDLVRVYQTAWKNIGFISREHEERRFEEGKAALRSFFDREEISNTVPALVEERFSFLLDKDRVSGRWDRVDECDGKVTIMDFKSSAVHQQKAANDRTRDSLQLAIYALGYALTRERRPDAVELHYLESGLIGVAEVDEAMLDRARERIQTAAQGIRSRDYTANPSYQTCRFCAFADVCPSNAKG